MKKCEYLIIGNKCKIPKSVIIMPYSVIGKKYRKIITGIHLTKKIILQK